jgi:menaquinone-dependent protoporphyrinogen IX oxidase
MKGLIIYKSNYGSTKQYAEWIGEETGFALREAGKVKTADIRNSDTVIIGCPVFANKPLLAKWIRKKWNLLKDKKLALYTTSGAKADDPALRYGFTASFDPEMVKTMEYFPQGGKMVFSELSGMHRFFMSLGQKMQKDPEVRKAMVTDKDLIDRSGLEKLLAYVK